MGALQNIFQMPQVYVPPTTSQLWYKVKHEKDTCLPTVFVYFFFHLYQSLGESATKKEQWSTLPFFSDP